MRPMTLEETLEKISYPPTDADMLAVGYTPPHPPTDADMLAMGYTPYDIECIREFSPAFNSESELEAKRKGTRAVVEIARPDSASYAMIAIAVAFPLGMMTLALVIWMTS